LFEHDFSTILSIKCQCIDLTLYQSWVMDPLYLTPQQWLTATKQNLRQHHRIRSCMLRTHNASATNQCKTPFRI